MKPEFNIQHVDRHQREQFVVWQNRFVDEYNRSRQHRRGHQLIKSITQQHWAALFQHNVSPAWIRYGDRNIGFVSQQQISIGVTAATAQDISVVSDVYVDPKFRGRGLLTYCLLAFQAKGFQAILIDQQKLLDNSEYYANLGYAWGMHWPEQDLLIVSKQPQIDPDLWFEIDFCPLTPQKTHTLDKYPV